MNMDGYVDVAERIRQLREKYPHATLRPWNPDEPFKVMSIGDREFVVYTAACYRTPDDPTPAIAVAAEPAIGKTNFTRDSEVMNAETSAWGRAIVAALAADSHRVASMDEVRNRQADRPLSSVDRTTGEVMTGRTQSVPTGRSAPSRPSATGGSTDTPTPATPKQLGLIRKLSNQYQLGDDVLATVVTDVSEGSASAVGDLSKYAASKVIEYLMSLPVPTDGGES